MLAVWHSKCSSAQTNVHLHISTVFFCCLSPGVLSFSNEQRSLCFQIVDGIILNSKRTNGSIYLLELRSEMFRIFEIHLKKSYETKAVSRWTSFYLSKFLPLPSAYFNYNTMIITRLSCRTLLFSKTKRLIDTMV